MIKNLHLDKYNVVLKECPCVSNSEVQAYLDSNDAELRHELQECRDDILTFGVSIGHDRDEVVAN
jgi:hypothetical protein